MIIFENNFFETMSTTDDKKKALQLVLEKLDKTYGKGTVMTLGKTLWIIP